MKMNVLPLLIVVVGICSGSRESFCQAWGEGCGVVIHCKDVDAAADFSFTVVTTKRIDLDYCELLIRVRVVQPNGDIKVPFFGFSKQITANIDSVRITKQDLIDNGVKIQDCTVIGVWASLLCFKNRILECEDCATCCFVIKDEKKSRSCQINALACDEDDEDDEDDKYGEGREIVKPNQKKIKIKWTSSSETKCTVENIVYRFDKTGQTKPGDLLSPQKQTKPVGPGEDKGVFEIKLDLNKCEWAVVQFSIKCKDEKGNIVCQDCDSCCLIALANK